MDQTSAYIITAVLLVGGLVGLWIGFRKLRQYRVIADTPTSTVRSMAIGLVELVGAVKAEQTLLTPFSDTECVYYRYAIEEYRRHVSRDSKGRTRTSYRWETIQAGSKALPFMIQDDSGRALVEPGGAEFHIGRKRVFYQKAGMFGSLGRMLEGIRNWTEGTKDPLDTSDWQLEEITGRSGFRWGRRVGDRRMTEHFLRPNDMAYVLGTCTIRTGSTENTYICRGENESTYIISDSSEKKLLSQMRMAAVVAFVIAVAGITGGVLLLAFQSGIIQRGQP